MEPDEPNAEELGDGHLRPTVIVGISDDEAGKPKEEIDCQVRVTYKTKSSVPAKGIIEEVKDDDEKGRAASQAIQNFKVFLSTACPVGVDCGTGFCGNRRVHYSGIFHLQSVARQRPDAHFGFSKILCSGL
jgi:hypothetical protein